MGTPFLVALPSPPPQTQPLMSPLGSARLKRRLIFSQINLHPEKPGAGREVPDFPFQVGSGRESHRKRARACSDSTQARAATLRMPVNLRGDKGSEPKGLCLPGDISSPTSFALIRDMP